MNRNSYRIAAIVEGHGEQRALPTLLRRWLLHEQLYEFSNKDPLVLRVPGVGKLLTTRHDPRNHQRGVEYFVGKAARQRVDAIIIVLDGDKECALREKNRGEKVGPEILRRARAEAPHIPVGVAVADPEFEAWFLTPPFCESLERAGVIPPDRWSDNPFAFAPKRNCKKLVSELLGRVYSPAVDQGILCEHLQFTEAFREASRSYNKLLRELERLTQEVRTRRNAR